MSRAHDAAMSDKVKQFYSVRRETNWAKRYRSPYPLRRYFCRTMWDEVAVLVKEEPLVLDAGCGDGVLSVLMALRSPDQQIVAMDISSEAVGAASEAALVHGVSERVAFVVGDAEHLPFKNECLPAVVSSHALEHLSDSDSGVQEMQRVLKKGGIGVIAMPACLNPSAMVLLGGDSYWCISRRTPIAFWRGLFKVLVALLQGNEGVQEGYTGRYDLPHVRRFPWKATELAKTNGLEVVKWTADSLLIPYLAHLLPPFLRLQRLVDKAGEKWFWRNFGVGVIMVTRRP